MIFRRFMIILLVSLTAYVVDWSMGYADLREAEANVGLVIGAVNAPVLILLGYAMTLLQRKPEE